jgi:ABC-type transporter Mla subunit MlaD
LEAIEAQLERVTTVADKLDATLKNLNVTLDKTNSIFKSSTDALSSNLNSSLVKQQNVEAVNNLAQNINTTSANLSGGPNICNIQK